MKDGVQNNPKNQLFRNYNKTYFLELSVGYSDEFQFLQALKSGYRMEKPEHTPNCVASVMQSCWNADPNLRPTFTQIEEMLDAPLESFVTSFYLQLNEDYQRLNAERLMLENFTVKPAEGYAARLPLRPTSSSNFYALDPVDQSKNRYILCWKLG